MINCLVDYIGLKFVQDSPSSDLFVNDLHGITTEQFKETRELDENNGLVEAWETLEGRAIRSFERDIKSSLKKYYRNHSIIHTDLTGYVDDNTIASQTGQYSGWLFDMGSYSQAMKLKINDIRINLPSVETFNLKIFDANTGEELYTKSITGTVGVNIVKILQEYAVFDHNKIFVAYDTIQPYRIFNSPGFGTVSEGVISTGSTVLASSISSGETGLAVGYNVACGIDEFVCSRLDLFLEPYLYKLGLEFLRHSKYSENVGRYTLLDSEQRNELINEYTLEYQRLLDSSFEDLTVPDDGICFICAKSITKKALIP